MRSRFLVLAALPVFLAGCAQVVDYQNDLHPTATALVSVDPYFSVWSFGPELNADVTRHWTGRKQPLLAALRVDGKVYRVLGNETPKPGVPEGRIRPLLIPDTSYRYQAMAFLNPKPSSIACAAAFFVSSNRPDTCEPMVSPPIVISASSAFVDGRTLGAADSPGMSNADGSSCTNLS